MNFLEYFSKIMKYYRPSFPVPEDVSVIMPNDMYPKILQAWPNAIDEGKVKIRSAKYKVRTRPSFEAFALHTKVQGKYRPFIEGFRECGHSAADLAGQFYHNKDWAGQAIGTIIYANPVRLHELNIVFLPGVMAFWEPQDGVWKPYYMVAGQLLDIIWIP